MTLRSFGYQLLLAGKHLNPIKQFCVCARARACINVFERKNEIFGKKNRQTIDRPKTDSKMSFSFKYGMAAR